VNGGRRYEVGYDPRAAKELRKLDRPIARRIARAVDGLAMDPRAASSTSLLGHPDLRRLRVGDHRVIYTVRDAELVVLALQIVHRSRAYRDL
jgi:mRNA interferase RelE/StbE